MSVPKYTFKGIDITDILQSGSSTISEYGISSVRATNVANSNPATTGFQINGVDIANSYAAKHSSYNTNQSVAKPNGATRVRYMIVGGSGGGGGGCGGGTNNDGQNHSLLGYSGRDGDYGEVRTGVIAMSNSNNISITIGNGGGGGDGGAGKYTGPSDNISLIVGTSGNSGNATSINNGTTTIIAGEGQGGSHGINTDGNGSARRLEKDRGHSHSFIGAQYSTSTVKGTTGWGNTTYGVSDNIASGNVDYTPNTPLHSYRFKSDWEDNLTEISSSNISGGAGGSGGWGYSNNANSGLPGSNGSKGKATLIWLYD